MIYLKNFSHQVREYKDTDTEKVKALLDSGKWTRVNGLKDKTPYVASKSPKKKTKKQSK